MGSSSLLLSCFKWSILNNGQLEFTFHDSHKCHPLLCRMTKCQKCHPQYVWSRDVTNQNVCFYKPSVYKIHFKISQCLFKILFSFHLSSNNYQHGSEQSFSPVKLQYPLAESGPFLQIWVSLCSSSFKTNHLCHFTFIITSRAFITS